MSETEAQNPTPRADGSAEESISPDPLLDSGSFIEPNVEETENVAFAPGTVIAAQPISIVAPDGSPVSVPRSTAAARRNPEEMAKRPSWLPENWKIDLKVRTSGATAGLIDRYYVAPTGLKFRSKIEVMHYLETGKKQKRKLTPEADVGLRRMMSDTRSAPRAKNKVDDSNLKKKLSNRKEMGNYSFGKADISSLRRLGRETSLSRHSTRSPHSTKKSEELGFSEEKRKKETKEKNVIQLLMESEKAEFQLQLGRKRKKMTAHAYKSLFKPQRIRGVVSDTNEAIEGHVELSLEVIVMDKVVDVPPDSVDSENSNSLPRSRDGTVRTETGEKCMDPKDINGLMDSVVDQTSNQDYLKRSRASLSVSKLPTNSSPMKNVNSLEREDSTCSARLQDAVVSESGEKFPESENHSLPAVCNVCSKRKRVSSGSTENDRCSCGGTVNKDLGRLSACKKRVQYFNESPSEPNTDNSDVGHKRRKLVNENVDPESVQVGLNGHEPTQVADRERGPSIIATCNQSHFLQNDCFTATSNLNSNQTSSGEISLSDEQKSLYSSLLEELMRICNILKLSEDVAHIARRFLEYIIKNHHVSNDSPAIVQAFQMSLCWIAASISKQNVDQKDSLMLARQHLNYQCEEHIQSVYSKMRTLKRMYLSEHDLDREPFKNTEYRDGRSEIDIKISKIQKKCRKRQKKLQCKQQEKIQELHKIWEEKRILLEKDHQLETAFIRALHSEVSVRTEKLKRLNEAFAWKIEDHNLLKDVDLENLEAEQLAAMNEEKQKAERWLTEAKACYSEPIAVNVPPLIDSQSNDNAGVSHLAIDTTVDTRSVVSELTPQLADQNPGESESTRHLEDQNPSESVCANGNAPAFANTSFSAPAESVHCNIPNETRNLVTSDSQNEVGVTEKDRSSIEMVEQPNQSTHLCDSGDRSVNLTTESTVEVPGTAPNENVSQDKIHSSSVELPNQNGVIVQNQHDSRAEVPALEPVDTVTAVQSNGELEEGEILEEFELEEGEILEEFELEEGEIQEEEPTMENQGTVNSETVAIVDPEEEEQTMENQRIVNSETVAIVEPVLITEQQHGNVPVFENQHTSEVQVETLQHVDSLSDSQSNVELRDLEPSALEIESTSAVVANSDLDDTVDPRRPITKQPQVDAETVENQNTFVTEVPISSQTADVAETEVLPHETASQIDSVQPITEQPQGDADTVENQKASLIEVPFSSQTANVAETEALSHEPVSQIDSIQPITEQPQADAETVENQNASLIEVPFSSKTADVAETEVLSREPAFQIDPVQPIMEPPQADAGTVESRNTSVTEIPISSQSADVAETEVLSHELVSQIDPVQPITEQLQADAETVENENASHIEVPSSSQNADVAETEVLSHEPISQSLENLETRNVSDEQIVELASSSESNEHICETVMGEAELSIEAALQNGISASYLYGSGYPSLNTLPFFGPLESQLEKINKEKEGFEKSHVNMAAQLKSDCEKEIEEITNQIKQKYGMKLQVGEAEFRQRMNEFEKYLNKLQMNMKLAEAFRSKCVDLRPTGHIGNQQGTSSSVYMQQMHQRSMHPSVRVPYNASNFQPSPSYANSSSAEPQIMLHQSLARPTRSSPITGHSVTVPPVHSVQHMSALFSTPPRPPPVISSITPHNPRISGEVRSPAPHVQSFRPSVGPTASPSITQYRPTFQNGPGPQGGPSAQPGQTPSTMHMYGRWEMDRWSRVRTNSGSVSSEIGPNYTSLGQSELGLLGNVQGNRSSSVVANDIVCLSDDD